MLDAFALLLFQKIFQHNYRKPNTQTHTQDNYRNPPALARRGLIMFQAVRRAVNDLKILCFYVCLNIRPMCFPQCTVNYKRATRKRNRLNELAEYVKRPI